tara:strand:+ start:82 stop:621 length:540 start_codon:yes stop_codon:yes gene_type:complete
VNKLCVILLCFPALLFGQQTIIKEIKIKPYMYTQNYEHFKRLVLDSPNSEAEYVDGFDFEWGYFYTLKVKETYIGELSDGTRYEYSLLKVISKEKVPDTLIFRMSIDPLKYYHKLEEEGISNYTLSQLNDSTYLYMDQVEIEIPQNFLESFRKKKDDEINFRGDFKFVNGKRVRLVRIR